MADSLNTSLGQRSALLRGEISARELVTRTLQRAERASIFGAFVSLNPEIALAEADAADALIRATPVAGRDALPPLLGLPTAHKDLVDVRGVRTSHGSRAVPHPVAAADDPVVAAIRAAGAISIGKTQVPEFGIAAYSENDVAPPARNPFASGVTAGGSSGGTAAAIAAGVFPAAIGSDAGGSIRIPAAACGLIGLKPGRGRVPADTVGQPSADPSGMPRLAVSGPIASTVLDAAFWFDALVGDRSGSALSAVFGSDRPQGLDIAVSFDSPFESWTGVSYADEAETAVRASSALLRNVGHRVRGVRIEYDPRYPWAFTTVWTNGLTRLGLDPGAESLLGELATMFLARAGATRPETLEAAVLALREFSASTAVQWDAHDVILTPALGGPPPPVGAFRSLGPEEDYRLQCEWAPQTSMVNVVGRPAVVVPAPGVATRGRPVCVQLIGRQGSEVQLLQLARQLC